MDDDGKVIYGGKKHTNKWEQKWRMKFLVNGFVLLLGIDFVAPFGCPRDLLHHILLGLFGYSMASTL